MEQTFYTYDTNSVAIMSLRINSFVRVELKP